MWRGGLALVYSIEHFVDGQRFHDAAEATHALYNPTNNTLQAQVYYACPQTVEKIITAAHDAFSKWSLSSLSKRVQILFKYKKLLEDSLEEIAHGITREHGKTFQDAVSSIQRGLAVVDYACGIIQHLKGEFSLDASNGIDCYAIRQPLGVCVGITPYNFPAMIALWMFPLAIACGNTFILKPSEQDPSCALHLAQLMTQAGLPNGVLNVVQGDKTVVEQLITHPLVNAISFVGSSKIAEHISKTARAYGKKVQAFGSAKNHCLVMPDANIAQSTDAIIGAAYGSTGQRCMAISVVVTIDDQTADQLVERLTQKIANLTIGTGTEKVDIGPLISNTALENVKNYLNLGVEEGAQLVVDGRTYKSKQGNFIGPSLFDRVTSAMKIYQEEIFGPVLCIIRMPNFDEALNLINQHKFGNGAIIFTNNPRIARDFSKRAQAGMIGINVPIPVPIPQFSFGGWKKSNFSDLGLYGEEGIQFYTKLKSVTMRWPDTHSQPEYHMPSLD